MRKIVMALFSIIVIAILNSGCLDGNNNKNEPNEQNQTPYIHPGLLINEIYRIGPSRINLTNWWNSINRKDIFETSEAQGYLAWVELYNPTAKPLYLNKVNVETYHSIIYFPINLTIQPYGHLLICNNISRFSSNWSIINDTRIFESSSLILGYKGCGNDLFRISIWEAPIQSGTSRCIDSFSYGEMEDSVPFVPTGHSMARYKNGHNTNNNTNDFYDEPNPSPGYENNRVKS